MRLKSLSLRDFRGFRDVDINMTADIVVIYGRNGVGKSTIFDAIEFVLFKSIRRLKRISQNDWLKWLPNLRGDGEYSARLELGTGHTVGVSRRPPDGPQWIGGPDELLGIRTHVNALDDGKVTHALLMATHLLTQNQLGELAVAGALDTRRLAALTGADHLNATADKAKTTASILEERLESLQKGLDSSLHDRARLTETAARWKTHRVKREALVKRTVQRIMAEGLLLESPATSQPSLAAALEPITAALDQEIANCQRTIATIDALLMNRAIIEHNTSGLTHEHDDLTKERKSLERERKAASAAEATLFSNYRQTDLVLVELQQRQSRLHNLHKRLLDRAQFASEVSVLRELYDADIQACSDKERLLPEEKEGIERATRDLALLEQRDKALSSVLDDISQLGNELDLAARARARLEALRVSADVDVRISDARTLLREHSQFSTRCSLCGTEFSGNDHLLDAIDAHITQANDPGAFHPASDDIAGIQRELKALSVRKRIATKSLRDAHGRAAMLLHQGDIPGVLTPEDSDANDVIERLSVAISATRNEISPLRQEVQNRQSRLDTIQQSLATAYEQRETNRLRVVDAENRLNVVNASVQEASETPDGSDMVAFDDELRRIEADMAGAATRRELALHAYQAAVTRTKVLASRHSDVETRYITIQQQRMRHSQVSNLRNEQLVAARLPADATDVELKEHLRFIRARMRTLDRARQELAVVSVQNEYSHRELQEAEATIASIEEQERAVESDLEIHRGALRRAQIWCQQIERRVADWIDDALRPLEREIFSCFSTLVPNAYRYESVTFRRTDDNNIAMGLKLRHHSLPLYGESDGAPEYFLSAAQMSVLALSIFLTLAEGQRWSNLETVMIDDPLERLDNLDAVALLDGLREFARRCNKQLIISTCDADVYRLMIQKFGAPWNDNLHRLIALRLEEDAVQGARVCYDVQ